MNLRLCVPAAALVMALGTPMVEGQMLTVDGPRRGSGGQPFELRGRQLHVEINGQVARTSLELVFYNSTNRRLEATFLLPMPPDASIERFTMDIDGKPVGAELLAADKAREIYESIVRRRDDPALLEYIGHGVLRARVFPIEPHAEKRINLKYAHVVPADGGLAAYGFPLSGAGPLSAKIELETERPLAAVYCPHHDAEIRREEPGRAVIGFEANDAAPGRFEVLFAEAAGKDPVALTLLTHRHSEDDGFFLLLASPNRGADAAIQPKDVVFVLDSSGSMAGDKLEQAKHAMRFCLANLNEGDRFEIVRFSTDVEPLFGALEGVDEARRAEAAAFVDRINPIGGTAISDALTTAINTPAPGRDDASDPADGHRPRFVVFLTDGKPTIGETAQDAIVAAVRRAAGRTRVFCFGIGTKINTHLLDEVTEATRAVSEYVLPTEDIELKVSRFYTRIDRPVMIDPSIALETAPEARVGQPIRVSRMYPADLPDLFSGDQVAVLGRYRGNGPVVITLSGTIDGDRRRIQRRAVLPLEAREQDFVPRLWAMRRVGTLLDEIRLRGENKELRDEIVHLARRYGIVTPYTAYLIVEDEQRRDVPTARRTVPRLRDAAGDEARAAYADMIEAKDGAGRVAGVAGGISASRANSTLKRARVTESLGQANRHLLGGQDPERRARHDHRSRFVGGRAFVFDGHRWNDTSLQEEASAEPVRIAFSSDAYFALLRDNAEIAPWLSVGRNVQFVYREKIYEIVD